MIAFHVDLTQPSLHIFDLTDLLTVATAQPKLSVPRRVGDDIAVHQHGYCRAHVHPKRFPLAYTADWQVRILLSHKSSFTLFNSRRAFKPGKAAVWLS